MADPVLPEHLALQRLYHWERTAPARVCFTQPQGGGALREFTWAQVMGEVRRMATHLRERGVRDGVKVGLLSKNCAHWMMADWAIWMAGGVSVPLYPTLAASTIRQILVHSEAQLLFVGKLDGWEMMKPGIPDALPCIGMPLAPPNDYPKWDDIVARSAPLAGEPVRGAGELATLIYTSGTTGVPKGVMQSFGAFAWSIRAGLKRLDAIDPATRMLSYLPLAHVAERALVEHGQLVTGMHLFFAESLETFANDLQRARPTVFFSVPRLWVKFQQGVHAKMPPRKLQRLLHIPLVGWLVRRKILRALGLDHCRIAACGAAPLPPELREWYRGLGLSILDAYGMTENCGVSHATHPLHDSPGTVGPPYDGVECRTDPASGEIQMRSPGLMMGYYKAPGLTREAMTDDGWLRTGDKGEIDAQGNLRITGRVKDLFKTSKGKYVSPAPIEDQLVMHPAVEACCVIGANLGQPMGIVMLSPAAAQRAGNVSGRRELEASFEAHLRHVNEHLDPHEQMDCLITVSEPWTVDNGFITPTFKVKRNRVEEAYGTLFDAWSKAGRAVVWHHA